MILDEYIPAERLLDWVAGVNVGVVGGIDQYLPGGANQRTTLIDVTQAPYNADNTGATDASAAINSAISACPSGQVVYLPAGTYRIENYLDLNASFNGCTIRGAGIDVTILDSRVSTAMGAVGSNVLIIPGTPITVEGGLTKGSTTLTVSEAPETWVDQLVYIYFQNDDTIPVVSVYNFDLFTYESPQRQLVKITGRPSSTEFTIDPPLYADHTGIEVRLVRLTSYVEEIGIEDMTIDSENFTSGGGAFINVGITAGYNCWMKGVKSVNALNYGMGLNDSLHCQIRKCYAGDLKGSGSNGAGLLTTQWACLTEDSIFPNANPNIEVNGGSAGNAFCYNFGNGSCNTNHAPHNRFNLHEGNAWQYMISDGYFGGESDQTTFRNFFWIDAEYGSIAMRRFSRRFSVLGNVHGAAALGSDGYPNIANIDFTGTAQLSMGDPWRDYQMEGSLITRTSDTEGEIEVTTGGILWYNAGVPHVFYIYWGDLTNQSICIVTDWNFPVVSFAVTAGDNLPAEDTVVSIGPGAFYDNPGGSGTYQEKDLDVAATVIDKGNFYKGSDTYTPLGGDPLPDSAVYTSEPSWWFSSRPWPPFDATDPEAADLENIPSGYRFTHGGSDPPESGGAIISVANVTNFNVL